MAINNTLIEIVKESTVRIGTESLPGFGTGFFITPERIITCYHCIEPYLTTEQNIDSIRIPFYKGDLNYFAKIDKANFSREKDLAILETVEYKNKYCVKTDSSVLINDQLFIWGFSQDNFGGESITLIYEGTANDRKCNDLMKFKNGKLKKGTSGSAILNLRSGYVVGLISESEDPNFPQGGYGIPIQIVFNLFPKLKDTVLEFSFKNRSWEKQNECLRKGIGEFDNTLRDEHFNLFSNLRFTVDDLFIEPNYEIVYYDNELNTSLGPIKTFVEDSINLLLNQKFLLLIGNYGSGKTILSKILQKKLMEQYYDVIFIRCADIEDEDEYLRLRKLVGDRKSKEKLFMIIDSFDEMNFLDKDDVNVLGKFINNLIKLSNEPGLYIILNSRILLKKENNILMEISYEFINIRKRGLKFIKLKNFEMIQIKEFLDAYANIGSKYFGFSKRLYSENIKKMHKNLKESCKNPLMLFWLLNKFYEEAEYTTIHLYDLFESFVRHTIEGKFSYEGVDNRAIEEIKYNYKEFLSRLALRINSFQKKILFDTDTTEVYLDQNTVQYTIDQSELDENITSVAKQILDLNLYDRLDTRRLKENILSCYFLESYNNKWRFTDNNILMFLVADFIYGIIQKMIISFKTTELSIEEYFKSLKMLHEFSHIKYHPLMIEFLLLKLKRLPKEESSILVNIIKQLMLSNMILSINIAENSQYLSLEKLNIDFLLCLIYLQLNNNGYNENNLLFFFKRFNWLISAGKMIDRNYLYLARRFFRNCTIIRSEFRRINFDGFNFDYSKIIDVKFIQNKIYEARKCFITFQRVVYKSCEIYDVHYDGSSGDIEFNNCEINKLVILGGSNLDLNFKRCYIQLLQIEDSTNITITFQNCDIDRFMFKNSSAKMLKIDHSFYNPFDLDGSDLYYTEINSTNKTKRNHKTNTKTKIHESI